MHYSLWRTCNHCGEFIKKLMMKTVVKNHPLKDIILEFDESKEPLAIETAALELYYEAHDVVYAIKQRADQMRLDLLRGQTEVEELYMEALLLLQELEIIEESLNISTGPEVEIDGELTIEVTEFFFSVEKHNKKMQDIHGLIDDLSNRHNESLDIVFQEGHDDYHPVHEKYFSLFDEVYPRYEEVSVNIVTLDEDEDYFKQIYGKVDDVFQDNFDIGTALFERYNQLYEFTKDLYQRTERASVALNQFLKGKGL